MTISEPATTLTDYLLAVFCLYFGTVLYREARQKANKPRLLFGIAFFTSATAALVGGTFHGFALYFAAGVKTALWNITIFFIGITGGFMVGGGIIARQETLRRSIQWLAAGVAVTLFGFAIQQSGIQFAEFFNHNDLFHLTQIIGFYFLYKLARGLD